MKKDFAQLVKDMRIAFRPAFSAVTRTAGITPEEMDKALAEIEAKQNQMVTEAGYLPSEFNKLVIEYFMDFSSENPEEWVIRHDPENAEIISGN
jgi:hypothetical protein